ncbi:hypothetical protein FRC11_002620 [Ceratobasidium sp. 423]|nr:hypothetical protein FRC11_002620 [Ceratobasidium sp. 423]
MAKTYVLSSPPKTTDKTRAESAGGVRMSVTPTRIVKPNSEDVEMRGASDGWETMTQDSAWEDEPGPSTLASLDVQHRLLYRGALSIPGSAILLEGIQFIARLPGIVPPLLAAPLPLALESMRGIPALKLLGTMKLTADTARLDTEIDVRIGKLELVAARLLDPACQSDSSDEEINQDAVFAVPQTVRPPRPDDPLPREPPTRAILKRTESSSLGMKRAASKRFGRVRSEVVVRGLGEQVDTPLSKPAKSKEPTSSVKGKSRAKGKSKAEDGTGDADDPFTAESEVDASTMLPKMMARVKSGSAATSAAGGEEATNKALVKRLAQSALETYGVDRDDPGFKEIFGYVTRGVGFAFRNKMKCEKIARDELRRMVVRHVEMYIGGNGEVSAPA